MANPFDVDTEGLGLETKGFVHSPFPYIYATFVIDGLELTTFGFIYDQRNSWVPTYQPTNPNWVGSSTCISGC